MPELPEVEAWRRVLDRWLVGRRVTRLRLEDPAAVRRQLSTRPSDGWERAEAWAASLAGQQVVGTARVGKRLGIELSSQWVLVHLGMTGRFARAATPPPSGRLALELDEGPPVWFVDQRRFGCWVPLDDGDALQEGLGPDALLVPLDAAELGTRLTGRRAVKVALMDQARVAGLGNIHVVEALWRAGIAPQTRCSDLDDRALGALATAVEAQLREAVETIGPADEMIYVTDGGENPFAVYGREGQPCPRCGAGVVRAVQSGRSTFWCATCQPA